MRRSSAIAILLLLSAAPVLALNPALTINQYAHTAWTLRDGAFKGYPRSLAQTTDGYLWLGTEFGLLRFDGVRFVPWQPPAGTMLPNSSVVRLLASRDGSLWIGTAQGLARWQKGTLTSLDRFASVQVGALLEDAAGTIWVGTSAGLGGSAMLCAIRQAEMQCTERDDRLGRFVMSLHKDRADNLWVGTARGLWRWSPGEPKLYGTGSALPEIHSIIGAEDDGVLVAFNRDIKRAVDGRVDGDLQPFLPQRSTRELKPTRLLRDRGGSLWIGTQDQGLLRMYGGTIDRYTTADGLSGELISDLFEDREGNVWVATLNGLDRFHDIPVTTLTTREGLSSDSVVSVAATRDGSVWFGTANGLTRWQDGRASRYHSSPSLIGGTIGSLLADNRGRLWVSSDRGLAVVEGERASPIADVPAGFVHAMAADTDGNLWIADQERGLVHLRDKRLVELIGWARFADKRARALAVDGASRTGGLWLGFFEGGVVYVDEGQVRESYDATHGLGKGEVGSLWLGPDRAVWVATQGGLSRLQHGRIATLTTKNGLPCDAVHWVSGDATGSIWVYAACGLVRIPRDEVDAWVTDSNRTIKPTVYDDSLGVPVYSSIGSFSPKVTTTADGRLWFATYRGVAMIDPQRLPFNTAAPPVHIESVTADRSVHDASSELRLPSPVRDLRIDYTALSLVAAERVRFRYRLEGRDDEWVDAGSRRQAFYTDLAPKRYRFQVIAANNDGVWNRQGATWEFEILPAYYQTLWFKAGSIVLALAVGWMLFRARLRRLAAQQHVRFEERLAERTRVAQELHDTLLQGFVSASMQLHVLADELGEGPVQSKLARILDQVRTVIDEGRQAVTGLRSHLESDGLDRALARDGDAFRGNRAIDLRVVTNGKRQPLRPVIRDDVYQIGREAIANAFRHAHATRIEVQIEYGSNHLRLRVSDNGCGIQPGIVEAGRSGHWGLQGMRERSERIGASLKLRSRVDAGTEVELLVPGQVVFEPPTPAIGVKASLT